jgi:hypothetical protein
MQTHRFGRKVKLPSTRAIKHEVLTSMWRDALKAQALQSAVIEKPDTKDANRRLAGVVSSA